MYWIIPVNILSALLAIVVGELVGRQFLDRYRQKCMITNTKMQTLERDTKGHYRPLNFKLREIMSKIFLRHLEPLILSI